MRHLLPILFAAVLATVFAFPALADEYQAVTTSDPAVPTAWLEIELRPMTKAELAVETAAWRALLKAKATEIGAAEILKEKGEKVENLPALREERDALVERLEVAMAAFSEKGGDVAEYEAYVGAVAGRALEGVSLEEPDTVMTAVVGWLKSPEGGLRWLRAIVLFFVVLLLSGIVASILGRITGKAVNRMKNASELLKDFFVNTVKKLTLLIGLVVALSALGIEIGPFVAAIGAAGFIIGFALQGTLSNFASGLLILLYRPYDIGDFVDVAGVTGKVEHMSLVSTSVVTPDNQTVVVPNASIWGNVIRNVTGRDTRRVDLSFGIGYGDDVAKAQRLLEGILADHPLVLDDPAPVIRLHELADSSVNFIVRPWAKTSDYWDVYWDVTRAVKERFDAEGITIPYPQQEVTMRQAPAPSKA